MTFKGCQRKIKSQGGLAGEEKGNLGNYKASQGGPTVSPEVEYKYVRREVELSTMK